MQTHLNSITGVPVCAYSESFRHSHSMASSAIHPHVSHQPTFLLRAPVLPTTPFPCVSMPLIIALLFLFVNIKINFFTIFSHFFQIFIHRNNSSFFNEKVKSSVKIDLLSFSILAPLIRNKKTVEDIMSKFASESFTFGLCISKNLRTVFNAFCGGVITALKLTQL